jgi:CPA2 family monovalent cation:H+ antiporter-2
MALTPVIMFAASYLARKLESKNENTNTLNDNVESEHHHVIIAGFGRVGRAVANVLNNESIPFVALDTDPKNVSACHQEFDLPVYHGDASNAQLLKKAGIEQASAVILTMNDAHTLTKAVAEIRRLCATTPVIVRSINNEHSEELMTEGATLVVPELHEASLQLAGHALCAYNYTREEADACIELVRRHNYDELKHKL